MLVHRSEARFIPSATPWVPIADAFAEPSQVGYEPSCDSVSAPPTKQRAFIKSMRLKHFVGRVGEVVILQRLEELSIKSCISLKIWDLRACFSQKPVSPIEDNHHDLAHDRVVARIGSAEATSATYSITSSARPSSGSGTVRPSALAVFKLITSVSLVGN